jgi:large repetitive protein
MKQLKCFGRFLISETRLPGYQKPPLFLAALFLFINAADLLAFPGINENILPPVAICKNISVQLGADGSVTITGADVDSGSNDPDGIITNLMVTPSVFDCSNIGPNSVTLIATDNEGLSSSCNATVTVEDKTAPVVNVKPFELFLDPSGTGILHPENVDNGTSDNCTPVTLSLSRTTFNCSDLGNRQITVTATDQHGNSSSRTTTVTVSSTLKITGMSLSSCDLSPSLALFKADIEGGNGTYSYLWNGIDETTRPFMVIIPFPPSLQFFNTSVLEKPFFNNTMANGIYNIRLVATDGNGCTDTSEISVEKTGLVFNNTTLRYSESCEGEVISYSVNDEPDAAYSWSVINGTILTADQNTNRIDVRWDMGVTIGVVTATLQEPNIFFPAGQCESFIVDSVTISPSPVPAFAGPVTSVCSESDVTYTLTNAYPFQLWTVTGGVITGGGNVEDNFVTVRWDTGPAGSVLVTAGNNSFCMGSIVINVSIFNLSGSITSRTDITCNGGSDGTVTALAAAGTGQSPYSYSLDGGTWQLSGTFTGIPLGNHIVSIRDALLCTFDLPFMISQPEPVSGAISSVTGVSCFGGTDGYLAISAAGGTPPYQYSLNGGAFQDQNNFSGLAAGAYTISIRDSHNCTVNIPASVEQPVAPLDGAPSVIDVLCFGGLTGRIDMTVAGGTPPYSFVWNNGATTEDILNVAAGNYTVVITDANGCAFTASASVAQPAAALSGSTTVVNVICYGESAGSVNLEVTGGTPPYTFIWNNGATTEDISGLTAGNYTVTVTDDNGCTASASGTIAGPAAALGVTVGSQSNVLCRGESNGSITVNGTGGTGPYEYRLNAGSFQSSGLFGSLPAGAYTITARDANMCTFDLSVTITEPAAELGGSLTSQTDIMCFGESTGSVTASASGGTPPYQYNIDGGSFQSPGQFNNLAFGPHVLAIRDNNLCIATLPLSISQPAVPLSGSILSQTNIGCFGESTGSITVSAGGGTSPYTYSINGGPFQPSGTFDNLPAGSGNILIQDANMCQISIPVTLIQPSSGLMVTVSKTDVLCFGQSTGDATATASGGTSPYTYTWNSVPVQTGPTASGLSGGSYEVTVTDLNGCSTTSDVLISQPAGALAAVALAADVECYGGSSGSIALSVINGVLPITYLWSNGAITEDLTGIPAGAYTVTVTDANGCSAFAGATVNQPGLLEGIIVISDAICFGGNTGTCDLTITGGILPYTFLWSNGSVTEDITGLASGNYSVTIEDANGCTIVVNATVGQPVTALSGSVTSQTDVTVYGGNDGSVTVAGSGGTPPYEFSLNSVDFQSSGTFTTLVAGIYTVTLRDANMCTYDITVTIVQPVIPLELNIVSQSDVACNGGSTGSVTISGWGGYTPYEYSIDGGPWQSSGTFSALSAGTYDLAVRDASLESFNIPVTISEPELFVLVISGEDILCYGAGSGSAAVEASGGMTPYSYSWNTSPVQATPAISNTGPGSYTVTVTDGNGCIETANITLSEPPELSLSSTVTSATCPDSDDGAIILTVTGGLSPYNVLWHDGSTTQNRSGLRPGTYSVVVTDQNLCAKSLQAEVGFATSYNCIVIPQVITPNNDGYNDEWIIRNIDIFPEAEVLIYNRWGKLVFRTKNLSANPWDGGQNDKLVPTDSYHYILYLNDGSAPRSGVISVIR